MVDEENKQRGELPIDSLIALSALKQQKRLNVEEASEAMQKARATARATLEALVEAGLAERHGNTKGRSYTLAAQLYRAQSQKAEYTLQRGFEGEQQGQMVVNFAKQHQEITRSDVVKLCRIGEDQATRLLRRLVEEGKVVKSGERRWTRYRLPEGTK